MNPAARAGFEALGGWAVPLTLLVATACAGAGTGVWLGRGWGRRVAVTVLGVKLVGDLANAALRGDRRTLIGLPIGGCDAGLSTEPTYSGSLQGRWLTSACS